MRKETLKMGSSLQENQEEASAVKVTESLVVEIAALWREHLDGREVGVDDDFFELGGNSLIGIKIIDRITEDYGVVLSVRAFYLASTPAKVADLIEQERTPR